MLQLSPTADTGPDGKVSLSFVLWLVNLVFPGANHFSLAEQLERVPPMLRPALAGSACRLTCAK